MVSETTVVVTRALLVLFEALMGRLEEAMLVRIVSVRVDVDSLVAVVVVGDDTAADVELALSVSVTVKMIVDVNAAGEELVLDPVTGPAVEPFAEVENPLLTGPGAVVSENEYG